VTYSQIRRGRMAADAMGASFTQIANLLFRDRRLTPKAMGIFGHISTHRDGYGITVESIANSMKCGVDAVKGGLRELEQYGYLVRHRLRNPDGTLGVTCYEITDMPDGLTLAVAAPYGGQNPSSQPEGENPPQAPTSGDTTSGTGQPGAENPLLGPTSGNAQTPRSEPEVDYPAVDNPRTKKTKDKNTNNPQNTSSSLRDEDRVPAGARETISDQQPIDGIDPPGPSGANDQNRTGFGLEPVAERAKLVAAAWWEPLEIKPMGKGAWHSLLAGCRAALERGWTPEQVLYVLQHRAQSVPTVRQLETWLREEKAAAQARRSGGVPGAGTPLTRRQQAEAGQRERQRARAQALDALEAQTGQQVDTFDLMMARASGAFPVVDGGGEVPSGRVIEGEVA
jgi:hypothetical protein